MDRRVVRVTVPTVKEYDVVFEDGQPVFIGAVIPREASRDGPNAGKIVDTHRTTWDGRNGGRMDHHFYQGRPLGHTGQLVEAALRTLGRDPEAGKDRPAPAQLSRPWKYVTVGRPLRYPQASR